MADLKLGKYQHYKGKFYEVIGKAIHSETHEKMIVYRTLYSTKEHGKNCLCVRPKSMFLEKVTVDGKKVPRFKYIGKL